MRATTSPPRTDEDTLADALAQLILFYHWDGTVAGVDAALTYAAETPLLAAGTVN